MKKGKFIVFDGADNLGKTTQLELVYNYLLDKGYKVTKTREPGADKIGLKIRDILLNSKEKLSPKTQLFLFLADRNNHYNNFLKPMLEEGYIILCDRYTLSTLVYQHKIYGIDELHVDNLNNYSTNGLKPNKTFVFYGNRLIDITNDEFEKNLGNNSHNILNNYYMEYGMKLENHILINANRDKDIIFKEIISYLDE